MRHLHVYLPASMHQFLLLLFILGLGHSIYAASIFQFPDLTRRLPERTTSPGCAYKGDRYEHGERVPTAEPCLNCTCIRAVLVCYLRVCPTASAPPPGCFAAREVGECCPTLVCGGADLSRPTNNSDSSLDLRPTFKPEREETTLDDSSTIDTSPIDGFTSVNDSYTNLSTSEGISETDTSTIDDSLFGSTQTLVSSPTDLPSSVSESVFHTTLNEDDSLVYITSTQEPTNEYDMNFFNDIPGGCMVNGTLYGDGSAMLSSTFCEYCFCIRGKSTCLKPKCHLTIDGCIPHYDNHYSCCPSRYDCSQRETALEENSASTELTTSSIPETTEYIGDSSDCLVDGRIYHQGEVVPDRLTCHNCYCSDSSVVCEKIKCSPPLEGCQPIIPEGHCCPISYRCDYQSGHSESNSIKGANLNESALLLDSKKTDIKSIKNYFAPSPGSEEIRVKTTNDRESISLLHNVIPIHRRLDENVFYEQNSTVKNIDEESTVYIGQNVSKTYNNTDNIPEEIRENDKTLEPNNTVRITYPPGESTFGDILISDPTINPQYEQSSTETVSVGSPEVHTLSIQELFDQFFSKHQINSSKVPGEISLESKRNNSKQPSSIVEIFDSETNIPDSTTQTTIPKINRNITKTENLQTDLSTASYSVPIHATDLVTKYSPIDITEVAHLNQDTSFVNLENSGNEGVSSVFPNAETHKIDEFQSRADTESTYPAFISTRKNGNGGFKDSPPHSPSAAFTASDVFNSESPLETSPLEILTALNDLFKMQFSTQPDTHTTFPFANTRDVNSEGPKQTQLTSPVYDSTKNDLIEGLKTQTESRPVVLIYDSTKQLYSQEPKTHSQTQTTTSLYDIPKQSFEEDPKRYTETQPTSLWYEITKQLFGEAAAGLHSESPIYTTAETLDSVNKQSETHSYPDYTSIRNLMNEDPTETPSFPIQSSTTTRIASNKDDAVTVHFGATTRKINNGDQTQTQFSPLYSSTEFEKEPEMLPTTTLINKENVDNNAFKMQTNPQSLSSLFTTMKYTNSEDFSKATGEEQTSPTFISTKYQNNKNHQEQTDTNPTTKTILTTKFSDQDNLETGEIETTTFFTTKIAKDRLSDSTLPSGEITEQKESVTTEGTKMSTRINSKLPSFNYIEKTNEKNSSTHSRFPGLTDSVVNVYLTDKGKNNTSSGGDNFTNIGSIYLGAPLSVGGTDSRKDNDSGKPKITQSGGVIFMDPKYTDIDTKASFEVKEQTQKDAVPTNSRQQIAAGKMDKESSNNERKKGPRIQDASNQSGAGQGYKIIPFVAEDAVRGQFGKINNTHLVQPESTEGIPDMVSDFCFISGRIYMNGEMIGKPDPCELCRCFYGRELCQIQRCPTPPDCIPEKVPGFCCPRFTCGKNATSGEQVSKEIKPVSHVRVPEVITSTTRKPDITERNPVPNDKQEIKFGSRVRTRPTIISPIKSAEYTTEKKVLMEKITTAKPEIRTLARKTPVLTTTTTTTTTTSRKPHVVRPTTTSKKPEIKTTTTTAESLIFPDPWGLLKVSGCNIYGKFFNINDQVEILSGPCSHCICTTNGVECNDIC